MGGLGIKDQNFDFRPFGKLTKKRAERAASIYQKQLSGYPYDIEIERLEKTKTKIYTPKLKAGITVSLIPRMILLKDICRIRTFV